MTKKKIVDVSSCTVQKTNIFACKEFDAFVYCSGGSSQDFASLSGVRVLGFEFESSSSSRF